MESLMTTMRRTLAVKLALRRDAAVVVALSGGADSVALLSALLDEGYHCVAAHCNFHLRGEESIRDMRFVEKLTARLGVDLYVKDFNVAAAMAATGESLEMACRRLRYEWFEELLVTLCGSDVAVGHHREDNVETFFLNLARGTGIAGLTGMSHRRGCVVRPLLDCSREQIEEYLRARGLSYVTDSTNAECEYRRNRVRNRLLPLFNELLPGATEGVERTMAMLADARRIYDERLHLAAERYGSAESGIIDVRALSLEKEARTLLFELLRQSAFSITQVDNILADTMRSGATFVSSDRLRRAELSRGELRIGPNTDVCEEETEVSLYADIETPLRINVSVCEAADFRPESNPAVMYMDAAALDGNPRWTVRRWRRADRIRPYGMTGSRLVSDIFSDAKMTPQQKRDTWILLRDNRIVWVVGVRASAHFAVGPRTRRYCRLEFCNE